MEIYHLPGDVNISADIMSRAVADNLNCALNREHPISKQWAKVIPPIPDNFSVDRETLFKFLTTPLKPERQDTHDRRMRKLSEPKSVQQWFDISKGATSEERFYNSIKMLEQWNENYDTGKTMINAFTPKEKRAREAFLNTVAERTRECTKRLDEIMEQLYGDIKNTALFKKVRGSLLEASKLLVKIHAKGPTTENVSSYNAYVSSILKDMEGLVPQDKLPNGKECKAKVYSTLSSLFGKDMSNKSERGTNCWESKTELIFPPKTEKGVLVINTQENFVIKPNEVKVIDLGVRTYSEKGTKHTYVPDKYTQKVHLTLNTDILCVETGDYSKISLQN
jgi:hypothetical protein